MIGDGGNDLAFLIVGCGDARDSGLFPRVFQAEGGKDEASEGWKCAVG